MDLPHTSATLAPTRQQRLTDMTHKVHEAGQVQTQQIDPLILNKRGQASISLPAGDHDAERLATVEQLQEECKKLRAALAQAEAERNLYLKALYANTRGTLHFEDVDIPDLEAASGGPLEILH
jgi:hypothetical protein